MIATIDREVILELVFDLIRLLRNVNVRAKADSGRESERRRFLFAVDQIVPVLLACSERIYDRGTERRVQGHVAEKQTILGEVSLRQINARRGLVVQTKVRLIVEREKDAVIRIEGVIDARVNSPVVVRRRQKLRWLGSQSRH